jgi:hypothetical protein
MSTNKTPLQTVKEMGGKEKLVDRILGLLDGGGEDKDSLRTRLLAASNSKLLRLANVGETLKQKYEGSTEKLAGEVAQLLGRAKDNDYVKKLSEYTPARLLDMAQSLARRAADRGREAAEATKEAAKKQVAAATKAAKSATAKATTRAKAAAAKAKTAATKAKSTAKPKKS